MTTLVLAPREVQVLGLVADGLSDRDVGRRLRISEETVGTLLQRAMGRMKVTCRAAAVGVGFREGFLVRRPVPVRVPRMSPETAQVLVFVAAGRSNREIGLSLGIGEAAAGSRVSWLLRAFGAVSRANLVRLAVDAGVLTTGLRFHGPVRGAASTREPLREPLRAARRAAAATGRRAPEIASGGLLEALLAASGLKPGDRIPGDRLDALVLAGLADGLSRPDTFTVLKVSTSAGRRCIERVSADWGVRGDVLLVAEAYRRGVLEPQAADPLALTEAESELLALIASVGTYLEIAALTGRNSDTVGDHSVRMYRRIGARNAANAVKRGVDTGALDLATLAVAA